MSRTDRSHRHRGEPGTGRYRVAAVCSRRPGSGVPLAGRICTETQLCCLIGAELAPTRALPQQRIHPLAGGVVREGARRSRSRAGAAQGFERAR